MQQLKVGLVQAPRGGLVFAHLDEHGEPQGVPATLARAYAAEHGLAIAWTMLPNSGALTDALAAGTVDLGFMPIDDHRRTRVAFGPAYYELESTWLAMPGITEVDAPHVRTIGIADTTTIRAASRTLRHTTPTPVATVDEALDRLRTSQADALALSRDVLGQIAHLVPGAHILEGGFQRTGIAVAVPPGPPEALARATTFLEVAKADGTVRRAFDAFGFEAEPIAG